MRQNVFRPSSLMKCVFFSSLVYLMSLLLIGSAQAHKVNIFAYAEDGKVYTESYFPDGRAVEQGTVLVYTNQEKLLLEGQTDAQGLFSFEIPVLEDLIIVIDAGMGHRSSFRLKKADLEAEQ